MSIEDVTQAKAALLAAGQNLDGKCGAHKIAAQTAWNMRTNGQGWGLVHSTGSGCTIHNDIYRADSLMQPDGTVKDILLFAESLDGAVFPQVGHEEYNIPAWNDTGPQDPGNWRAPYDPGLLAPIPPAPDGGGDIVIPLDKVIKAINDHTTAEADRVIAAVLGDLKRLEEEVEQAAAQLARILLLLRRRREEPDEPEP